jgi:hypothetical protein
MSPLAAHVVPGPVKPGGAAVIGMSECWTLVFWTTERGGVQAQ